MPSRKHGPCALCHRERPLTFHHFIPRRCHANKWFKKNFTREQMQEGIDVCRDCHSAIHKFIPDHKVLAREHHSREKLLANEQLAGFVEWIRGRHTAGRIRTRRTKD